MLLPLAIGLVATLVAASPSRSTYPPYLDPATNASGNTSSASCPPRSSFVAPPTRFFAGIWSIRNTSSTSYQGYGNLQWDLYPALPNCDKNTTAACPPGSISGVINEVTTWAPADNKTALCGAIGGGRREVASVRAYNTPRRLDYPALNSDWDAVFENSIVVGPATGYRQSWSVIYWGQDVYGMPYIIVHEAPAAFPTGEWGPPAVHMISINPDGPDEAFAAEVLEALMTLGNEELTAQIKNLGPTIWDEKLKGGPAICGCKCQNNEPK